MNKTTQRRVSWGLPVVFAIAAIGFGLGYVNLWAGPVDAQVVRVIEDDFVLVRWARPDGNLRQREITLPDEYTVTGTVPIRIIGDDEVNVVSGDPQWLSWQAVLTLGVLGALLGFVVAFSLAGHGYVRGTGEAGTTKPEDVREDRGFYWRS